jgi:predicted Zn finger-like uncharacterized protein
MPVRITCPSCETSYTVADAQRGKKLVCRKCKETITVPAAKEAPAPRAEAVTERKPRPVAKVPARRVEDEEEETRPRKKRDEEEARPRKKVVKAQRQETEDDEDEDDEEEAKPRKKKGKAAKKAGALSPLMIGAAVGAVALIVVAVVVVMLAIQPRKPAPPSQVAGNPGGIPGKMVPPGGRPGLGMPPDGGLAEGPPANFGPVPIGKGPAEPPAPETPAPGTPPAGQPPAKEPPAKEPTPQPVAPPTDPLPPLGKQPAGDPPAKEPAPTADPPAPSGGVQLDRAVLTKVKLATLYLRITLPDGSVSQGSGFFGVEPGLVLTNAHVLGMLNPDSRRPQKVEVVYKNGEPDARTFPGEILGVDRSSDLAVLRVKGPDLPKPLDVRPAKELLETQQVYIIGFPFGETLGRNVTVSLSSVSSLRKNAVGELVEVQVNGGMHPGNSGGPVVNARGEVVGVAVAGIKATQINFAVPGEFVHAILNGRITTFALGETLRDGKNLKLPFTISVLDPLGKMQKTVVEFWVGKPGPVRRPSSAPPAALEGDGNRQRVEVKPKAEAQRGEYTLSGEFTLPARGAGQALWIQPAFVNGTGQPHWLSASTHVPTSPLDRVPIVLALRHQAGGRLVSVSNRVGLKILHRAGKELNIDLNVETKLAESMTGYDQGRGLAAVRMRYHEFKVHDPKGVLPPEGKIARGVKLAATEIKKVSANLVVDPTGKLVKNEVDVSQVSPQAQKEMTELHAKIQESLESVEVTVPNRQVQPGETWVAQQRLLIVTGEKVEQAFVETYYTYQGVRERDGRKEAIVTIAGRARGPDGRELKVGGKVTGQAKFDVFAGQFAEVEVKAVVDLDVGEGVRGVGTFTSKLERSLGRDFHSVRGTLTNRDARDADGRFRKVHPLKLTAGRTYTISLESFAGQGYFDTYLIVESSSGRTLAQDDDGGVDLNSLIIFRPEQTGTYRIVVTSYRPGVTGSYALVVRER